MTNINFYRNLLMWLNYPLLCCHFVRKEFLKNTELIVQKIIFHNLCLIITVFLLRWSFPTLNPSIPHLWRPGLLCLYFDKTFLLTEIYLFFFFEKNVRLCVLVFIDPGCWMNFFSLSIKKWARASCQWCCSFSQKLKAWMCGTKIFDCLWQELSTCTFSRTSLLHF